uniref:Rho-GAP domain-containing protein n=2 Tax=Macrostomum lignano TaxID=282301 RepID=A0A1I8GDR4_9PLAT
PGFAAAAAAAAAAGPLNQLIPPTAAADELGVMDYCGRLTNALDPGAVPGARDRQLADLAGQFRCQHPAKFAELVRLHLAFLVEMPHFEAPAESTSSAASACGSRRGAMQISVARQRSRRLHLPRLVIGPIRNCYKTEGIFRKTGSCGRQKELLQSLTNSRWPAGAGSAEHQQLSAFTVHDVASVMKHVLRSLDEPLIAESSQLEILVAIADLAEPRLDDRGQPVRRSELDSRLLAARQLRAARLLAQLLPDSSRSVLIAVLKFLRTVADAEAITKMTSASLGTVFGPVLFCCGKVVDAVNLQKKISGINRLTAFLIENCDTICLIPRSFAEDLKRNFDKLQPSQQQPAATPPPVSTPSSMHSPRASSSTRRRFRRSDDCAVDASAQFSEHRHASRQSTMAYSRQQLAALCAHVSSLPESKEKRRFEKRLLGGVAGAGSCGGVVLMAAASTASTTSQQARCAMAGGKQFASFRREQRTPVSRFFNRDRRLIRALSSIRVYKSCHRPQHQHQQLNLRLNFDRLDEEPAETELAAASSTEEAAQKRRRLMSAAQHGASSSRSLPRLLRVSSPRLDFCSSATDDASFTASTVFEDCSLPHGTGVEALQSVSLRPGSLRIQVDDEQAVLAQLHRALAALQLSVRRLLLDGHGHPTRCPAAEGLPQALAIAPQQPVEQPVQQAVQSAGLDCTTPAAASTASKSFLQRHSDAPLGNVQHLGPLLRVQAQAPVGTDLRLVRLPVGQQAAQQAVRFAVFVRVAAGVARAGAGASRCGQLLVDILQTRMGSDMMGSDRMGPKQSVVIRLSAWVGGGGGGTRGIRIAERGLLDVPEMRANEAGHWPELQPVAVAAVLDKLLRRFFNLKLYRPVSNWRAADSFFADFDTDAGWGCATNFEFLQSGQISELLLLELSLLLLLLWNSLPMSPQKFTTVGFKDLPGHPEKNACTSLVAAVGSDYDTPKPTALSRTTSANDYEFNMFNERDESRCSSRLDQHISSSRPAAADAAAAAAINDFGQQPTPRRGARSDVSDDPPDELLQGLDNIGRNITHQDVRTMMAALQQQMERPVSKQVKIVKFTPSQDIHVWLAAFEQRCEMERIVDPFEMKQHLIASLDLATAYPSLLGMNLPRFASYEEVKQRLIERFARHGGADEYRELLRRRQQGKNESAEEFADALRTLGERAYPRMHPEDREKEITDQFLAGIRTTPDLRERLYWVRPNNLLAAIRELRRLEGAKELAHRSAQPPVRMLDGEEDGDPKPDVTAQALLTLTDLIEKQQRMLDHLVQRDQQQVASPPKRAIICYSCGQPGHRNTQCPMRQNQGNGQAESDNGTALREVQAQATWQIQNGREKKRMSAAQAPMPSPTVALSDAECGGFVDTSPNQKIHAREADPYVTGRVASREVPFLLDSGSRKNFLGSSTWAAIRRRMPRCIISHAIPDCVTMYDGTQLPLACKVTIPVEFGDVVADTEFLVTVSDCENLLGVSFMREHCQNLDFAQGMLKFNNGTCIPVRYSRRELQNCRVYTSEKCTLPPRSSALLAVRLDDGHPENRGSPSIVELVKSRLHPSCNALEAAPALMTMPEGRGYIEVVNTADSEVFLQAGIRVGVATPLRTADLMYLSETPEPEVRHLPKNSEESSTAWLDEVEINSELSKEQHQRLNHRKGKDHANADALSRRPEGPPIFFEHGRLLEQPGSTARPGDDHDLEPDLDPTPEATARAALQKTVHSRCLEAKTDLDEDLEATAPAAFQHDAHRCSQRLETGLDDNSEATATTALCRDAHAAYRNLETNLDEDLEATVNTDLLDDAQDLRSRNLETPTDQDSKATAPAALLMTARNATPGQQLKYNPPEPFAEISRHVDRGQNLAPAARSKLCPPGRQTAAHRLCGKSSPPLRHRPVLEKTHPILTTTEPTATAACDEACFTCCVPPYSQESPVLCSGGMRAAPSAESSVMRAMKRTSIRDQRTYADVVRQSPSERPNPDADKTVPCDRPGAIKAETAGIRTPQPCRAVLTDFLKLPMTRQQTSDPEVDKPKKRRRPPDVPDGAGPATLTPIPEDDQDDPDDDDDDGYDARPAFRWHFRPLAIPEVQPGGGPVTTPANQASALRREPVPYVTPEPGGDLLIRTPCSLICKSARCAEFVDLFISFRREAHLIEGRDLKELVAALPTLLRAERTSH